MRTANILKIAIFGMGNIGKHVGEQLAHLNPTFVDLHNYNAYVKEFFDYAFLCLPTDMKPSGECDTTIVEKTISEINANIIVIRSTVTPGFTESMIKKYGKRIVFQPEFWGTTQHSIQNHDYVVLGGLPSDTHDVAQLYMKFMNAYTKIVQTEAKTAELAKYMQNTHLAMKVALSAQFYKIAQSIDVDYIDARELMLLDKRISPSHTFITDEQPYYDSHCLNKDIPALIQFAESNGVDVSLLNEIDRFNHKMKVKHG